MQAIRLMSRMAPQLTSPGVREALGWSKQALKKHIEVKKAFRTVNVLGTLELSRVMLRFGFLTLIRASQQLFPPKRKGKILKCHGIMVRVTRYDDAAMEAIFDVSCIPVISSQDRNLLKRLF